MDIRLEQVGKRYDGLAALQSTSLHIASGQLVALLGPSGSGKTTLLRLIAGLLPVDEGRILFGGKDATRLSLRERRVGFVFQHYALFPHMSVFENIAFGLRSRPRALRPSNAEIERKVVELLELVQLAAYRDRHPAQLSGGQRQRVALARAMAIDPTVLLLDEPFGALDAKVRIELRRWLRELHDRTGFTTLFVTHDQEEALDLADRVVVMDRGRIEQDGNAEQVYGEPASAFVFDFLGRSNRLRGDVRDGVFSLPDISVTFPAADCPDGQADLFVRPHDLGLAAGNNGLRAEVDEVRRLAGRISLELAVPGQERRLLMDVSERELPLLPRRGEPIAVDLRRHRVFPVTA
ncbi:sulfate/molybdate ABC transporter ATP-binding protein [Arenimonas sp.]|uniref:sulfate/molybdate ABC transporter ATP-binding protein n=1 Tax=Arenimonas sp. TaxID=1872635 RepID=UPI0039E57818